MSEMCSEKQIINIAEAFIESVNENSDKTAFLWESAADGERTVKLSYGEFKKSVFSVVCFLADKKIERKKVALIGENSTEWCLAYFSVIGTGGIVVPMDTEIAPHEMRELIEFTDVSTIFTSQSCYEKIAEFVCDSGWQGEIIVFSHGDILSGSDVQSGADIPQTSYLKDVLNEYKDKADIGELIYKNTASSVIGDSAAVILFTSGTSGNPKAAELTHDNICFNIQMTSRRYPVIKDDIFWAVLPLHHSYQSVCGMLLPFFKGAAVFFRNSFVGVTDFIDRNSISIVLCVPNMLEMLHRRYTEVNKALRIPKCLRFLICGAAGLSVATYKWFNESGIKIVLGYGMTECSPVITVGSAGDENGESSGTPLDGITVIVDAEDKDGLGELLVRGRSVMKGYYNNDKENENAFTHDGFFKTGDIGRIDECGRVYIKGNKRNVIVAKNGKNIYPEELECALIRSSYIEEALVFGYNDVDGTVHIGAEIFPSFKAIERAAARGEVSSNNVRAVIQNEVNKTNGEYPLYKNIEYFEIRDCAFARTSTRKVKRRDVQKH